MSNRHAYVPLVCCTIVFYGLFWWLETARRERAAWSERIPGKKFWEVSVKDDDVRIIFGANMHPDIRKYFPEVRLAPKDAEELASEILIGVIEIESKNPDFAKPPPAPKQPDLR